MQTKLFRYFLNSVSTFALVLCGQSAVADDFTVNNAAVTTQTINGDDTLTVTESGSISPPASNNAVEGTGNNNTVTNNGSITTSAGGEGVTITSGGGGDATNNSIVNNGTVATSGSDAYGLNIDVSNNSSVTNNGTVATSGSDAYGIYNEYSDNTTITNNNSITTNGQNAYGVLVDSSDGVRVVNNGSISATNPSASSSTTSGIYIDSSTNSNVLNSGAITTGGYRGYGIWNDSSDNSSIVNSGTITTSGQHGRGINNDSSDVSITNEGTISTSGDAGSAIWTDGTGNNVAVTNKGSLTTSGASSYGINFNSTGSGGSVVNSGQITTSGNSSPGINVGVGVPIINTGTINTSGNSSNGINFWGSGATIANSGSIETQGSGSSAIYSNQNSTITNTGTLRSNGSFAIAAQFFNNNNFTNSGSIVSSNYQSIGLAGTGNTVTLVAPSYLGGQINLNTGNTINIETGASHSVLWDFSTGTMVGGAPNISGSVPWFYNSGTQQFATFDPTAFSARFNQLGDISSMVSRLGQFGLEQALFKTAGPSEASSASAYEGTSQTNEAYAYQSGLNITFEPENGRFWTSAFGSFVGHDGNSTTLNHDVSLVGSAFGYSWTHSNDLSLGVMAGYMKSSVKAKSRYATSQDIESEGLFIGANALHSFGALDFGLGISAGWQSNKSDRFVNDNLATTGGLTLGESIAKGSYGSWYVSPELALSFNSEFDNGITVTPAGRLRYAFQSVDSYSETNSNANATVAASAQSLLEGNAELAISKQLDFAKVTGRVGYLYRGSIGDDGTQVTMLGNSNTINSDVNDLSALYLGFGTEVELSEQLDFSLNAQSVLANDALGFDVMASLKLRF